MSQVKVEKSMWVEIIAIIIVIIGGGIFLYTTRGTKPTNSDDGTATSTPNTSQSEWNDLIQVNTPAIGATVTSPLTVSGKARGTWYFEASFPVKILDASGTVLAIAPAQAEGDWMTENFVPFSVTLTFNQPTTTTGFLVLKNDNPSGLAEYDKQISIPVIFSK